MELDPRLGATGDRASALANFGAEATSRPSPVHHVPHGNSALIPAHDVQDDHNSAENTPSASTENRDTPQHQNQQLQDAEHDGDGIDPKRPRACEACRGLKVRCEPDPNDEGPCKRCRKAGRNCVVTMPTRKRQKKTDSRVAELEKKIDALTASLQARAAPGGGQAHTQSQGHGLGESPGNVAPKPPNESNTAVSSYNNMKWRNPAQTPAWGSFSSTQSPMPSMPTAEQTTDRASPAQSTAALATAVTGQKRKFTDGREGSSEQLATEETPAEALAAYLTRAKGGDIVDRGVITMEKAAELFARYNDHMISHLPAIIFQPGFTASELRKTKPILFLAIMAVASAESPILQKVLQKEMKLTFAEKVMLSGEKGLELVQALNVAVIWYWPPEHFEELKFYQLVHTAAVMAIDIGLGQKMKQRRGIVVPDTWRPNPSTGPGGQSRRWAPPDPTSIESRRTWLTCYFLATNTSMALHRPNLIRWTPFMEESLHLLQSSPNAAPTDAYFCHLVWTHHLSEQVNVQFSLDDPIFDVHISETRTQYILKGLEKDLKRYREKVPPELLQPTLLISFGVLNLYMHEMALQARTSEPLRPPFSTSSLQEGLVGGDRLSPAHISAISVCLGSIKEMLGTFLAMDVFSIRCLPVFNFVRVAYAVVMLIKLYFSASAAGSELGRVIDKEDMQVGKYLDNLLDKFRATAAEDRCRPAAKFLVVLVMLRSWFYRQAESEAKESKPGPTASAITQSPSQAQQQPPQPANTSAPQPSDHASTANTPLQLLSEVATGAGSRNRDSSASRPSMVGWGSNMPQPPQPFFHDTPDNNSSSTASMPYHNEPFPADLAAAMAPAMPSLPPTADGMGGYNSGDLLDFAGWDLEGMGMGMGSQGMWEDGMRIFLEEPWFNTMFQGNPPVGNNAMNF
ncbi:hypothetical protein FOCG_09793 [Fusarium oxysporum f. sp. radicis-lycopersici 26381]|uniref:Zn(2)-C6 fungal-type domain-containing protein n=3 Tax=Fusarium oxysporum TaxID=5507 RepID=A0A2H3I4U9_FUSOX|nr:hypothetical protein FOCG_09793 [Fusarium oxysporum f. sp. radicis-lycopersici 26381]PCD45433.1 hypothetical protein AU210_000867 [Fusarium oxysporum f. sp. radicis-cucumerinum]RKK90057.1 hypothetical protein BFJ71_g11845 [Fusarium oxysporum]RYC81510.1 hypothetical protein BFJ63_vAg15602 [Fusarium oxysporum f. sp. narcissi]EXL49432.1 hypothetical protein FOCG_09793 [Fusarium oxysporum f. sp. radicis-lycopersici 26381]